MIDPTEWGVDNGYWDVTGHWRDAPQETVRAVLAAMGATDGPLPAPPS